MRILAEHMANLRKVLMHQGTLAGLAKHSDNKGAPREAFAKHFLSENLPQTAQFLTGEVFNAADERSGQIDLIVYPASCPRLNLVDDVNVVFADHCLAAIEVKSDLTTATFDKTSHLKSALESCVGLKGLGRRDDIQGSMVVHWMTALTTTPFLIVAYQGPTEQTLTEKLEEFQQTAAWKDDLLPDMITVLSRRYCFVRNNGWLMPTSPSGKWIVFRDDDSVLLAMYIYLIRIIEAYAYNPKKTGFEDYLRDLTPVPSPKSPGRQADDPRFS